MSEKEISVLRRQIEQNPQDINSRSRLIQIFMRDGLVKPWQVEACAGLGDPVCKKIFPNIKETIPYKIFKKFGDKKLAVKFAIFNALQVLQFWEDFFPKDKTPQLAIESAKYWLESNIEEFDLDFLTEHRRRVEGLEASVASDRAFARAEEIERNEINSKALDACEVAAYAAETAWSEENRSIESAIHGSVIASEILDTTWRKLLINFLMTIKND